MKGDFNPGSGKCEKSFYIPSFDEKVKQARSSKAKGELITVNPENVWERSNPDWSGIAWRLA